MPIVNYVREHTRFMEYACDEKLTSSERLLWYALMHVMNQRAQGNVWPDEFVRISNDRLLSLCPMKFDTMANARNSLKQRGLIEVERGEKNKKSPAYRMIYFYPTYVSPTTERDGMASNTEKSDNIGDNMGYNTGGNMGYNTGGNTGDNTGDFNINNKQGPILYGNRNREEDEETAILSHSRAQIRQEWMDAFGREPNPSIVQAIMYHGLSLRRFDVSVVCQAIGMAAMRNADSPLDYIIRLFKDWDHHKIASIDDLDSYLEGEA